MIEVTFKDLSDIEILRKIALLLREFYDKNI